MQKEYLNHVIYQFGKAVGEEVQRVNLEVYRGALSDWIKDRQKTGRYYKRLLKEMNVGFNNCHSVEIGKGRYDSIVSTYEDTSIISPFMTDVFKTNKDRIIVNQPFTVSENGEPGVIENDEVKNIEHIFNTYMTQNPYLESDIKNWENMPNIIDGQVVLGIYGSTFDKDYQEKIELLKKFKEELIGLSRIDGGNIGDRYCFAVVSEQKEKVKSLR